MDPQLSFNLQLPNYWVSLVAQMVKNLPAMQEMWVRSLGWEDSLEEGIQPTPVFLPGESPWTQEPGGLWSMGSQRVGHDRVTTHIQLWKTPTYSLWLILHISGYVGMSPRSPSCVRLSILSWAAAGLLNLHIFPSIVIELSISRLLTSFVWPYYELVSKVL